MNAGKSTMLNALLQKEILGTAIIPETANLSVIKYAKEEYAKVIYWNEAQWQTFKDEDMGTNEWVKESEEHFKEQLQAYIKTPSVEQKIPLTDLIYYTSANLSDKKSYLVKAVEVYTNLDYVQGGVEIVDTPGIDDPVIQREEITKGYLNHCDVMIHLMNASQSATQKDVDFILDALLYQNVADLLIIITHIDNISDKELQEVITYTKQSIKSQLENAHKGEKTATLLQRISFIPLAANLALDYRIGSGQQAQAKGYSLEDTGITKLEQHLSQLLFGADSPKVDMIINATQDKIIAQAQAYLQQLKDEEQALSASKEELSKQKSALQQEINQIDTLQDRLFVMIEDEIQKIDNLFISFDDFLSSEFSHFSSRYISRIAQSIQHSIKNRQTIDNEMINYMISFSIKDGLFDIIRDFRHLINKVYDKAYQNTKAQLPSSILNEEIPPIDIVVLFNETPFFTDSYQQITQQFSNFVAAIGKRDFSHLDEQILNLLTPFFNKIAHSLVDKMHTLSQNVLEQIRTTLKQPLNNKYSDLVAKDHRLNNMINNEQNDEQQTLKKEQIAKNMFDVQMVLHHIQKTR